MSAFFNFVKALGIAGGFILIVIAAVIGGYALGIIITVVVAISLLFAAIYGGLQADKEIREKEE